MTTPMTVCPAWCEDQRCGGEHWASPICTPATAANVRDVLDDLGDQVPMIGAGLGYSELGGDFVPGVVVHLTGRNEDAEVILRAEEAANFLLEQPSSW